ncbi:YceI family protein [Polaribacter undariae]|uniref:YceI family protein n=1 Tax=Polaribacter sejongensis TaxID=985043 RepID=A0AAJ1QWQ7_9FLAO|nr:YceI family protein [Polaribacter undariae]MDN3619308.1 YceI family protein [Polaribacter undariae]UWD33492.1 YceI family protein [Polaribacter undariae]
MKRVVVLSLLMIVAFNFSSCKSDKKSDEKKEDIIKTKTSAVAFSLEEAKNEINFVAYKTTEKVPVGGQFNKVDIISGGEGSSIKEAINNTEFSIPVSSIFTKDTSRDFKIQKFFFGVMDNTKLLSGKLLITDDTNGVAEIKMNGVTDNVAFTYTIEGKVFKMEATMDITKWNASEALASLNTACLELHKGADGVSKTWSDVALNITSTF